MEPAFIEHGTGERASFPLRVPEVAPNKLCTACSTEQTELLDAKVRIAEVTLHEDGVVQHRIEEFDATKRAPVQLRTSPHGASHATERPIALPHPRTIKGRRQQHARIDQASSHAKSREVSSRQIFVRIHLQAKEIEWGREFAGGCLPPCAERLIESIELSRRSGDQHSTACDYIVDRPQNDRIMQTRGICTREPSQLEEILPQTRPKHQCGFFVLDSKHECQRRCSAPALLKSLLKSYRKRIPLLIHRPSYEASLGLFASELAETSLVAICARMLTPTSRDAFASSDRLLRRGYKMRAP